MADRGAERSASARRWLPAAAQAQAVTIHELYPGLIGTGGPDHIAAGPDGNLWFTGHNEASIDRITPGGVLSEFFLTPRLKPGEHHRRAQRQAVVLRARLGPRRADQLPRDH